MILEIYTNRHTCWTLKGLVRAHSYVPQWLMSECQGQDVQTHIMSNVTNDSVRAHLYVPLTHVWQCVNRPGQDVQTHIVSNVTNDSVRAHSYVPQWLMSDNVSTDQDKMSRHIYVPNDSCPKRCQWPKAQMPRPHNFYLTMENLYLDCVKGLGQKYPDPHMSIITRTCQDSHMCPKMTHIWKVSEV